MRRFLMMVVLAGAWVAVPAPEARAQELDRLTCRGKYLTPVLFPGWNATSTFDIHCTRVEQSPFVVTPLGTGSAMIHTTVFGNCVAGTGSGQVQVLFHEQYVLYFTMAIADGVAQFVVTDGVSGDGADNAEGAGTLSTLPCCVLSIGCQNQVSEVRFDVTFHDVP